MKRRKIIGLFIIALFAASIAIYFQACKKEIVTPINNMSDPNYDYPYYTSDARLVVSKIMSFKNQLNDRENVQRRGLYMPIDSVIWDIEALFNSEYAFPDRKYIKTVKHDLEFFVDLNDNNEVQFGDVADLYDEITDGVRQSYANDGIVIDKSLMAVVVDKGETVGNRVKIDVHVVSGRADNTTAEKDPINEPFGPGDCWYYGEYGGTCDDPTLLEDAAEILEDTINYYYRKSTVPLTGYRYLNHGMFRVSLDGNEYFDDSGKPYLFFYEANGYVPVYLDYEMMNYYYKREVDVLLRILPSDPIYQDLMPINPTFIGVDILGQLSYVGNSSCYHHKNYVVYGSRALVPEPLLPPQRDLLN